MPEKSLKLFLDYDGVVFKGWHHDPEHRRDWSVRIEDDLGIDRSELVARLFLSAEYADIACGRAALRPLLQKILPDLGFVGEPDDFIAYWLQQDGGHEHLDQNLLGYVEHLRNQHGIECFLASAQPHDRGRYIRENMGISRYFKNTFFSCDVGYLKTDPQFYRAIEDQLGFNPHDHLILYFDDTPSYVEAAQQAGWSAFQYNTLDDFVRHPVIKPLISR